MHTSARSLPPSLSVKDLLSTPRWIVLLRLIPNTVPTLADRYDPLAATATLSYGTVLVTAINVVAPAMPDPKPPGMMSRLSQKPVSPCHLVIRSV